MVKRTTTGTVPSSGHGGTACACYMCHSVRVHTKYCKTDTDQNGSSSTLSSRDFFGGLTLYPVGFNDCLFKLTGPIDVLHTDISSILQFHTGVSDLSAKLSDVCKNKCVKSAYELNNSITTHICERFTAVLSAFLFIHIRMLT